MIFIYRGYFFENVYKINYTYRNDLFGSINSLTWPIDISGRIESNCWSRKCYENARKCLWWKYYLCQVILLRRGNRVLEPRNLLGVFDLRISSFIKKTVLDQLRLLRRLNLEPVHDAPHLDVGQHQQQKWFWQHYFL